MPKNKLKTFFFINAKPLHWENIISFFILALPTKDYATVCYYEKIAEVDFQKSKFWFKGMLLTKKFEWKHQYANFFFVQQVSSFKYYLVLGWPSVAFDSLLYFYNALTIYCPVGAMECARSILLNDYRRS